MKKLHIVTLKKFYLHEDTIYTYGGFPAYLSMLSKFFDEIFIIAPVTRRQFENPIEIDNSKFTVRPLPCYWNEMQLILYSPIIFLFVGFYLLDSRVVNPRIPDMTGIIGLFFSKLYQKPHFVSIQSDLSELLSNNQFTSLKGLPMILSLWLRFNPTLENFFVAAQSVYLKDKSYLSASNVLQIHTFGLVLL